MDMHFLGGLEIRFAGSEIDIARRTELPCRLEDIGFLAVEELYLLHVVERETPQVHLPVLGVAELDTVVIDCGMLASHGADINGLDAPHSAVVFELHA